MSDETGFLGDSLREFLEGEEKPNPSQYKKRTRERTEAALIDFYYLFEYFEEDELKKIFGSNFAPKIENNNHQEAASEGDETVKKDEIKEVPNLPTAQRHIEFAIAFFMRGLNCGEQSIIPSYEEVTGRQQPMFDQFTGPIEQGIQRYLRDRQEVYADVNVKIELENIRPSDELINDIEDTDNEA